MVEADWPQPNRTIAIIMATPDDKTADRTAAHATRAVRLAQKTYWNSNGKEMTKRDNQMARTRRSRHPKRRSLLNQLFMLSPPTCTELGHKFTHRPAFIIPHSALSSFFYSIFCLFFDAVSRFQGLALRNIQLQLRPCRWPKASRQP